jgi:hypothetical protein
MVMRYSRKIRFLALFVLAFVCLNAAGAVCVAYCRGFATRSEVAVHQSPEKSLSKHCDHSPAKGKPENGRAISVGRNVDVCPMTVSFLAASVEKKSIVNVEPILAAIIETPTSPVLISIDSSYLSQADYRGPPPLDRRPERIKHRLLLI